MTVLAATTTFGLLLSCEKENITGPDNANLKSDEKIEMPTEQYSLSGICGDI